MLVLGCSAPSAPPELSGGGAECCLLGTSPRVAQPPALGVKILPSGLRHILASPCQSSSTSSFNVVLLHVVPLPGLG